MIRKYFNWYFFIFFFDSVFRIDAKEYEQFHVHKNASEYMDERMKWK